MTRRLRERGVARVAASYGVIAWLVLQIASVVFDPLGVPKYAMTALIAAVAVGLPVAIALAWFLRRDRGAPGVSTTAAGAARPAAHGLRQYANASVIGALLLAVVILGVKQSGLSKPKRPDNPAIAVLPFENLSGDPQQEYFSDGLAEETLDRLGRVPGLRVIARSSSFRFKGKDQDIKAIAETLGVTTILEGSVRRDGKHLRLSARVIDGTTGQETWSGSFDREMTDVFKVQDELARAVVDAILPAAKGAQVRLDPVPTADLSAYDLYLLATQSQWQRTPQAVKRTVDLLERSIALDPNYAPAHAQLALALVMAKNYSDTDWPDIPQRRRAEAHRALALDPDQPAAQVALAMDAWSADDGVDTLLAAFRRVVERNPNYVPALHQYAVALSGAGHTAESLEWTERTLQVDPLAVTARTNLISTLHQLGNRRRRDEELAYFDRLFSTDADAQYVLARASMNALYDPVRAARAAMRSIALSPPKPAPEAAVTLHRALIWVGARDEASRLLASSDWAERGQATLAYEQAYAAGFGADRVGLDAAINALRALPPDTVRDAALVFWLSLAGRCAEAVALGAAGLDNPVSGVRPSRAYTLAGLGIDAMDIARHWCLIQTGHKKQAYDDIDGGWLGDLRGQATKLPFDSGAWTTIAALESLRGHDDDAVAALERAFSGSSMPGDFWPQLPWFARLKGRTDFDRLVAGWTRARQAAREQVITTAGSIVKIAGRGQAS